MNINRSKNKRWLATAAAVSSSIFLFAACEPRDDQQVEGPAEETPTYGAPDRDTTAPADTETGAGQDQGQEQDQW